MFASACFEIDVLIDSGLTRPLNELHGHALQNLDKLERAAVERYVDWTLRSHDHN